MLNFIPFRSVRITLTELRSRHVEISGNSGAKTDVVFPRAIKFRENKDVGYIGRLREWDY